MVARRSVVPFPDPSPQAQERLERAWELRRRVRWRIDRRARELAARDQERYFRAMFFEVLRGKVDPEAIPLWEPLTGTVGARGHSLDG